MKPTVNQSRRRAVVALTALLGSVALGACRGENLFSLTATVGGSEPQVTITAPAAGLIVSPGDSVLVLAEVNAQEGVTTIDLRAQYTEGGADAFLPESEAGGGITFVRVSRYLNAAPGQVAGDAYIVVEAGDAAGAIGKDSVKVSIAPN